MTLSEAATTQTPKRLRHLFAIILTTCSISNPLEIRTKYKTDLSEDILMQIRRENPQTSQYWYQRDAYNYILSLSETNKGCIVFLDAPGGIGKTFVINLLLTKFRQQNKIALAVASSGITATLLKGGRTAHSTFKLPLNLSHSDSPVCNIAKGSGLAKLLQKCSAIIWDECTMSHKKALEAVDRLLQDLRSNKYIMGGVVVVLAGDFRQTLPVIPRSTPADKLNACLKASYLWKKVKKMSLNTNMRVYITGDVSAGLFSNQLLTIGDGKAPVNSTTGQITFPSNFCCIVTSIEELKAKVFPNIQLHFKNSGWLCERAILAPKNDSVKKLNLQILNLLPGVCTTYKSVDTVIDPAQALFYPTEFLNSLEPQGLPPHNLFLKPGAPILLLRNLDPPKLCNGTRLLIKNLFPHVIEANILTGCATGEDVFIPTIPFIPSDLPFDFKRLQFPVRLAFAMSINKAQGQSLKVVGIDLQSTCFSHGQLYVACSIVEVNSWIQEEQKKGLNKQKDIKHNF
ncbi:ATP-dependent DNA helicase PIF1-like [Anomaloglossus baeobatrachus]|uniref:ATP-dependent DNA helicase PIF1-like n=1 Tax=Anomaloglossus baeobatrachus TaxID=238106 RepID=UPI003F4FD8F8